MIRQLGWVSRRIIQRTLVFVRSGSLEVLCAAVQREYRLHLTDRRLPNVSVLDRFRPDLTPCDFYLWSHVKSCVFSRPENNCESEFRQLTNWYMGKSCCGAWRAFVLVFASRWSIWARLMIFFTCVFLL